MCVLDLLFLLLDSKYVITHLNDKLLLIQKHHYERNNFLAIDIRSSKGNKFNNLRIIN